jgi:hypothetical protein
MCLPIRRDPAGSADLAHADEIGDLDENLAERLLSGVFDPTAVAAPYVVVAALLAAVLARPSARELSGEWKALGQFRAELARAPQSARPGRPGAAIPRSE